MIGNGAYKSIQRLPNPPNDAADLTAALKRLGFSVTTKIDVDRRTMRAALDEFGDAVRGADVALFYYSGHGVALYGENYLVPVNAEVRVAEDILEEGVPLQRLIGRLNAAGAGTNVILLDACRNNPFPTASRGMDRGLAVVGQKPPESLIVYATEAGETAEDGKGRNGTFTAALLKYIERPESFSDILFMVNGEVRAATAQKQKPASYHNLTRPVYLAGRGAAAAAPSTASQPRMTVTKSYGSVTVTARTGGTLYLDGVELGVFGAGVSARLQDVEAGDRNLELLYADGKRETLKTTVTGGGTVGVAFTYVVPARIGDTGPAGGLIFYDKGEFSDGWRYLEVAPSDQSAGIQWYSGRSIETGASATGIGSGKANTAMIVSKQGAGSYAAKICEDLVLGGCDDWFLPSKDELNLFYTNLKKQGRGSFASAWYWSSSEHDNYSAWLQSFDAGRQYYFYKVDLLQVRAVRAF